MTPYYDDGLVTIYHGDCREVTAWLDADVLVTDPPYGLNYESSWRPRRIEGDSDATVRDAALTLWGTRPALVFGQWSIPKPAGTKVCLIWDKGEAPGMGDLALPWGTSTEEIYVLGSGFVGARTGTVLRADRANTGNRVDRATNVNIHHPNKKPTGLIRQLIERCPPGVIADPFVGGGSTLRAAKDMGRSAVGVEKDERWCELAARSVSQESLAFG